MHNYNLSNKQSGLSLIELMIALSLGIIVIFGVTQSLITMSLSSRVQSRNAELLESADSALSYISFRMRNALSTPCENYARITGGDLTIQGLVGTVGDEEITRDQATVISNLINGKGIRVTQEQITRNFGQSASYSTDRVTLIGIGDRLTPQTNVDFTSTQVTIDGTFVSPRVGNETLYAITDCKKMDVFRASRAVANGQTTLTFMGTGGSTPSTNIETAYRVADVSLISPLDVTEISVTAEGNLTDMTIFRNSGGALLDNVDLIRILFSVDRDNDGIADQYITANQLNGISGARVLSADIYLLVRVPTADRAYSSDYTLTLPDTSVAIDTTGANIPPMEEIRITDQIQRKVFMRSVVFRNNAITL